MKRRNTVLKILSAVCSVLAILTSCSDKDTWIQTEMPETVDDNLFDSWCYSVPMNIKSNGSWEVKTEGDWFYVFPTSGNGNGTINICMIENEKEERNHGKILIIPTSEGKIQEIEISQKCLLDYGDMAVSGNRGSIKRYAVGYGYNTLGEYASPNDVRGQIVRWLEMDTMNLIQLNSPVGSFYERTVTGSSVEDLEQKLNAEVNFKGSYCGFKGEVGASFKGGTTSNEYNEYAISYVEYKVTDISIVTSVADIKENWLTPAAKKAINGTDDRYKGTEGVQKLFKEFGTHLIMKADLGGRLKYNISVDVSKVTGYYDIAAYAKASYANSFIDVSGSVDGEMKKSYEDNRDAITLSFTAYGGNSAPLTDKSNKEAIQQWKNSVEEGYDSDQNKTALIGFGEDMEESLIPLYELADSETRRDEIKAVMDGKGFVDVEHSDKKNIYQLSPFDFSIQTSPLATMVMNYKDVNGRVVAKSCNEFIPEINMNERITVYYPVVGGRVLYNAGYYPGSPNSVPARISWNGNSVKIVDQDESSGYDKTLYLQGATFLTDVENYTSQKITTSCEEDYMEAMMKDGPYNDKYPLVKILGHIWTRYDYASIVFDNGNYLDICDRESWIPRVHHAVCDQAQYLYRIDIVNEISPAGWKVPKANDYKEIDAMLTKYGLRTGKLLRNKDGNSLLGFEAPTEGLSWIQATKYPRSEGLHFASESNVYLTSDNTFVKWTDNGFDANCEEYIFGKVRLIKDN